MPVEVSVGSPVLTINQGSTFMVTDFNGEIAAMSEQGVFADDTRFVSSYRIFANGQPWVRLTSSATPYYAARLHLTNPPLATEEGDIPGGRLGLRITRAVGEGIHEDLDVTNYGLIPVRFNLEIALRSDFADLFEVKSHKFVRRGRIETEWNKEHAEVRVTYTHKDFRRQLVYRLLDSDSTPHYANGRVTFEISLAPGATWHSCCYYILVHGDTVRAPVYGCSHTHGHTELDKFQRQWKEQATSLTSTNEDLYRLYRQSVEDMGGCASMITTLLRTYGCRPPACRGS